MRRRQKAWLIFFGVVWMQPIYLFCVWAKDFAIRSVDNIEQKLLKDFEKTP